tara:strand:+ start:45699 stop:46415 length:717 start_codon:yes stop_codon:yes gene_type:complete
MTELAQAQEGIYQVVVKKQEQKQRTRWTLADWLAQKDRIRMMDYWLAMNTSDNPFEFSLSVDTGNLNVTSESSGSSTEESERASQYGVSAFASIVGITGRLVENSDGYEGSDLAFNLRLLGSSQQNTNITLEYGQYLRKADIFSLNGEEFKSPYYGASFTLYFIKYFGIKGRYLQIQKSESANDISFQGTRTEVEAFIDYGIIRIFGQWYDEPIEFKQSGTTTEQDRQGVQAGVKIFF